MPAAPGARGVLASPRCSTRIAFYSHTVVASMAGVMVVKTLFSVPAGWQSVATIIPCAWSRSSCDMRSTSQRGLYLYKRRVQAVVLLAAIFPEV